MPPVSAYFKGKGESVMSEMQDRYGAEKGKRVFYATAQKRGMNAEDQTRALKKRKKGSH